VNRTVTMFRDARQPGARDLFSCSLTSWRLLQELAMGAGWVPLGTTYLSKKIQIDKPALRDYEPGDSPDVKCVEHADAIAWAASLQSIKEMPDSLTLTAPAASVASQSREHTNQSLATLVDEFAQYAYGGSFGFVLADPSS
jgi:hypothetical protein